MEEGNRKIRFAIVGAGHIGKRHATMICKNHEAALVAMVDSKKALKTSLEAAFSVPCFDSLDALIASGLAFDVVNICTPNNLHASQALQALSNGYHVVLEKPMALCKSDCEDIIYKSNEVQKLVFCVMQNRYSPPSKWLKELVSGGFMGKINMVQVNCYWNRDARYYQSSNWKGKLQQDGGTLFTQFSHFIDTAFWLFGDIKNIEGRFVNFNHQDTIEFEDSGIVLFDFVKGGTGSLSYTTSCRDTNFESSITVIGEKGCVKVGGQYMNNVEYCHIENYTPPEFEDCSPANDYGFYKGSAANHHFVIENVIDTILGRSVVATNAVEGMKVVEIIEKIYSLRKV